VISTWIALAGLAASAAESPELTALAKHLAQTQELTAQFTQRRTLSALKDALESSGTFSWKRGGKLDWHTTAPSDSEILLDDQTVVIKVAALGVEQALDLSTQPQLQSVFQAVLGVLRADFKRLEPQYDLSIAARSPLALDLKPKSPDVAKVVSAVHLTFDAKLNLARVVLDEAGGDTTDITFKNHVVKSARP